MFILFTKYIHQQLSAISRLCFALLRRGSSCRNTPTVHQLFVSCNPSQNIGLGVVGLYSPDSFGEGAGPDPDFVMMDILIAQLTPEADLCPEHLILALVVFDHLPNVHIVEIHPSLVVSIGHPQVVAHSHIQVKRPVLGNNYLMLGSGEASAPPVDNIAGLNVDLIGVHPIHEFLVGMQFLEDFMLLPSVVPLHLHLSNPLLLQEFRLIGKASQNHLVSSQVHDRIRENIEYLRKHLFHQFVGPVESDIQRTHESSAKRAGYSLIFGSKAPARRVARSIELRHNSHSSPEAVLHDFSGLICGVGLLRGVAGVLGDFWM